MTASVFTLSIEPTSGAAFQAPFHVGTDLVVAMQCAEDTFRNRVWFPGVGNVTIRTVALMRDGRVFDVFDGDWMSSLQDADMAEAEAATPLSSALAFIPTRNLRNLLTFFSDEGDLVARNLIERELERRCLAELDARDAYFAGEFFNVDEQGYEDRF